MTYLKISLLSVLLLLANFNISDGSFGLQIEPCYLEELGEEVLCGTYEVMENRQVRKGAKIRLNFIILPARTTNPAPDPVFIFAGGPGAGAADGVINNARAFDKLRWERDIILVDQRGTGDSNPLPCQRLGDPNSAQTYLQDMFPDEYVQKCREELEKNANLRYYHSTIAMDDIDELREALGYDRINLLGQSYGSYAAIVYMKYHPERVRSAMLGFIAMPNWDYSGSLAPNTQEAWLRLLADCAADPNCANDYPLLPEMLDTVLNRLKQGPVTILIINPFTKQPETVTFTYNNFIHGLRSMLYSANRSRWIPIFIHWAVGGIYSPIAEYTAQYLKWINTDIMDGMYLCVTCTETIPYINYEEARARAEGTFMGTYRLDQQKNACDLWVRGDHPDDFHAMYVLGIPTLIFSGEFDPVTPPKYGEELAGYLPNSLHVIIPNAGHGYGTVWENCVDDVIAQFFSKGSVAGLDPSCVNINLRPPFMSWRDYPGNDQETISKEISKSELFSRQRHIKKEPFKKK